MGKQIKPKSKPSVRVISRGNKTRTRGVKLIKPAAAVARVSATKASGKRMKAANGLPRPSTKPWGEAGKALDGVKILDFTHVQSGPTCTQLLAYMGADCIKVERPGVGDITRGQLRDVKGADSLYFTMLNGNKRSITIDSKHPKGK
jgi:formyl-CoA transferase